MSKENIVENTVMQKKGKYAEAALEKVRLAKKRIKEAQLALVGVSKALDKIDWPANDEVYYTKVARTIDMVGAAQGELSRAEGAVAGMEANVSDVSKFAKKGGEVSLWGRPGRKPRLRRRNIGLK